ncbi:hypothetical protein PRZ48_008437 [Zasmidium cellare]|uniref:Uncharacterized protein n=1 Tax=Zasmidium cellare TaxID=395010 RepID=A0ABR0EGK5_ZASCE|nr:hypothetical protein PRZ48_008437 [Zasmidium cellare]
MPKVYSVAAYNHTFEVPVGDGQVANFTIAVPASLGRDAAGDFASMAHAAVLKAAEEKFGAATRIKTEPSGSPMQVDGALAIKQEPASPSPPAATTALAPASPPLPAHLDVVMVNEARASRTVTVAVDADVGVLRLAWGQHQGQPADFFGVAHRGIDITSPITFGQLGAEKGEVFTIKMLKTGIESLFAAV